MEAAYHSNRPHDFEISKSISLRQTDPFALLQLQQSGKAEFSLPEILFDHDFPGHYCRRLKSVSVSILCVVGPYTGTSCTLKLVEHRYRMKANSSLSSDYYPDSYDLDDRFHTDLVPISSIAVSSGRDDSGVFNLDFQGERYGPFEGAGVVSRWFLEFPAPIRQFDYTSISDVVMHVRYTALDGGSLWRNLASDAVVKFHKAVGNGSAGAHALFELKTDFPQQWAGLGARSTEGNPRTITLTNFKDRLPFWTTLKKIQVVKVWLALSLGPGGKDATIAGNAAISCHRRLEGLRA
jgi:hypothetical protein